MDQGKVAYVFPGQGAQFVGMAKEAFEVSEAARDAFAEASDAISIDLAKLCFEGPNEDLALTANTQPAVVTATLAIYRAWRSMSDVKEPDVVAGHSLGEYSANVVAGTLSLADAVKVVRQRGTFMQEAVPVGAGAMAAVMKAAPELVEQVCDEVDGVCEPANFNSPGQIVIAGSAAGVEAAVVRLKAEGARAIPLKVSAPFHSSLMTPAEERLTPVLNAVPFRDPSVPVYVNVDAQPATTAQATRDALVRQVSRAVRWDESIRQMKRDGVTHLVEIGPGKVLTGLARRIDKELERRNIQGPADWA